MSRRFAFPTALAATLLVTGAVAKAAEVALPPFYQSVTAMKAEGKLGQVIASEPVETSIPNAKAWRIACTSSDLLERPTYFHWSGRRSGWSAAGGVAVRSSHGLMAPPARRRIAAPRRKFDPAQPLNEYFLIGGTSGTDFGVPAADEFIKDGYVLVATDYQGLGGGGKHQYSISATQGRDTINAIRAVGGHGAFLRRKKAGGLMAGRRAGGTTLATASLPDYIARTGTAFDGVDICGPSAMAPHDIAALAPKGPDGRCGGVENDDDS